MLGVLENPNHGNGVVEELRKGKVKGGKDEEKQMDPIFPRLRINDAEIRGPKAPPRNKMALIEQPQKFSSDLPPISMLPLPPPNSASSHAGSNEKMFSPFCYPYSSAIHFTTATEIKWGKNPTSRVKENLNVIKTRNHLGKEPASVPSRDKSLISVDSRLAARTMRSSRLLSSSSEFQDEWRVLQENKVSRDDEEEEEYEKFDKKSIALVMQDLPSSLRPPENDGSSLADRKEEISLASAVNLSPDHMVRKLGQKLFWKARRTILHQQRIFILQIFELHRLIKVQKMVARSPDILFEDNLYTVKSSSTKNLPPNNVNEPKVYPQKPKAIMGGGAETTRETLLPVCKGHPSQQPIQESGPWCFQPPPGNQWLVPVRSPSEGLVYKPYSGPCPPPGGILAPLYGGCRPLNLSPYGMLTSHQPGVGLFSTPPPVGQAYFQPFAMPVVNPYVSTQKSGIISNGAQSLQTDRGSDLQGSTASCPSERAQPDALSLFPTTPSTEVVQNQKSEQRIQVIKVVPHNRNTASESAARIFKSIQEERKQH